MLQANIAPVSQLLTTWTQRGVTYISNSGVWSISISITGDICWCICSDRSVKKIWCISTCHCHFWLWPYLSQSVCAFCYILLPHYGTAYKHKNISRFLVVIFSAVIYVVDQSNSCTAAQFMSLVSSSLGNQFPSMGDSCWPSFIHGGRCQFCTLCFHILLLSASFPWCRWLLTVHQLQVSTPCLICCWNFSHGDGIMQWKCANLWYSFIVFCLSVHVRMCFCVPIPMHGNEETSMFLIMCLCTGTRTVTFVFTCFAATCASDVLKGRQTSS